LINNCLQKDVSQSTIIVVYYKRGIEAMKELIGTTKRIHDLTTIEIEYLFDLLCKHFNGIEKVNFDRDLTEKDYIILLYAENDESYQPQNIKGFSTVKIITPTDHHPYNIVFSGDTIIDQAYWGTTVLPKLWTNLTFKLKAAEPDQKWVWFLISSGYRTYRFLPVFFKTFYPTYDQTTPDEIKSVMDKVAYERYGDDYNSETGVISFSHSEERLKEGLGDVTEHRLLNPHIQFFVEQNPGHYKGDELVCITEIDEDNLTKAGQRMLVKEVNYD
jgi:hypothetical protein